MRLTISVVFCFILSACNQSATTVNDDAQTLNHFDYASAIASSYRYQTLRNPAPYIPPQCYTRTEDDGGQVHNPCYTCHTPSIRPNYIQDGDLQLSYSFAEDMRVNHWRNVFRDRSAQMQQISDQAIKKYIRASNYFDEQNRIVLQQVLQSPPHSWDANNNGRWDGFIPDAAFNFDAQGFDHDAQGQPTGWRSYAYYPFPGTFWPTNGSTNDVLIRLPEAFRQTADGQYDAQVYATNLAIVEAMIRERDIEIEAVDEAHLGHVDIDRDGRIARASKVVYDWAPLQNRHMWYVGRAHVLQQQGDINIAAGLFPVGTEFLHTLRYIDVADNGDIQLASRFKEVRYARKRQWLNYAWLRNRADAEVKEKRDFPDRLRQIRGDHERGVSNGQGWTYAGFIEDAGGQLRPQSHEELGFCLGCHGGTGVTRDGIISFARKMNFNSPQHGWHHWSQHSIRGVAEPKRIDGKGEYSLYLERNRAGDEFRANREVIDKFFTSEGQLKPESLAALQQDISWLLWPSPQRAMQLNRAYKLIVQEQSFIHGRDALVSLPQQVHSRLEADQSTSIKIVTPALPLAP